MANYTKLTDFASKDALPTGNAAKIVKGTEIDDEFEAIETAVATKSDIASPAFTGIPTAPTAAAGTNTLQLATTAHVFAERSNTATLTNKTVNLTSNTLTGTTAQFNTALSDDDFATLTNTVTLTNKTVNLANNTLTGTTAEFNTALSDDNFATLAGTETLTNKTITSPALDGTPTTPTAVTGTDTTQVASTAFVQQEITANAYTLPTAAASTLGGLYASLSGTTLTLSTSPIV